MKFRRLRKRTIVYGGIFTAGFCLILLLDYLGFLVRFDNNIYDLFLRLKGTRQTDGRIVIAAIDEKTLEQFGRWPFSRNYYSMLLEKTQDASAVGLDIIFTEASPEDAGLAAAIQKHGKVVLPVYLNRNMEVIYPVSSFAPVGTGHMHADPGVDGVVREVFHTINKGSLKIRSFSYAIYEVSGNRQSGGHALAYSPGRIKQDKRISQTDRMLINYYGPPATFPYISMADIVNEKYSGDYFRGKIVLAGFIAPGVVDSFITPVSQNRNRMPGIEIHANILNNLIDGSSIRETGDRIRYSVIFLLSALLFLLFLRTDEKTSFILWTAGLAATAVFSFILLAHLSLWAKPVFFIFSSSFAFATTYIYRLDEAARQLDIKYSSIVSLPEMGTVQSPAGIYGKGLLSFLSSEGINGRIHKLLSVEDEYETKLQGVINEKTMELSNALEMIKTMSNEMIIRLISAAESKDRYTGSHLSRIRLYAKELSENLGMPGDFVERITFASAMHDIGKIGIPDRILLKPGRLSPEEFEIMKTHVLIGEKILSGSVHPMIQMSATIALYHHEKWDGTGYARGLRGRAIPIEARIVMLCDVYEALRSKRPYKEPLGHRDAFLTITKGDGRTSPGNFDPDVLQAFITINSLFEEIFLKHTD